MVLLGGFCPPGYVVYWYLESIGGSVAVREDLSQERIPTFILEKENFQTVAGNICKGPMVREGQSLCEALTEAAHWNRMWERKGPLSATQEHWAKQSSWTDCPGQAQAYSTIRLQEGVTVSKCSTSLAVAGSGIGETQNS